MKKKKKKKKRKFYKDGLNIYLSDMQQLTVQIRNLLNSEGELK